MVGRPWYCCSPLVCMASVSWQQRDTLWAVSIQMYLPGLLRLLKKKKVSWSYSSESDPGGCECSALPCEKESAVPLRCCTACVRLGCQPVLQRCPAVQYTVGCIYSLWGFAAGLAESLQAFSVSSTLHWVRVRWANQAWPLLNATYRAPL